MFQCYASHTHAHQVLIQHTMTGCSPLGISDKWRSPESPPFDTAWPQLDSSSSPQKSLFFENGSNESKWVPQGRNPWFFPSVRMPFLDQLISSKNNLKLVKFWLHYQICFSPCVLDKNETPLQQKPQILLSFRCYFWPLMDSLGEDSGAHWGASIWGNFLTFFAPSFWCLWGSVWKKTIYVYQDGAARGRVRTLSNWWGAWVAMWSQRPNVIRRSTDAYCFCQTSSTDLIRDLWKLMAVTSETQCSKSFSQKNSWVSSSLTAKWEVLHMRYDFQMSQNAIPNRPSKFLNRHVLKLCGSFRVFWAQNPSPKQFFFPLRAKVPPQTNN